jgi:trigger factor
MDYKGQVQKKNKRKMPLTVKGFRKGLCLKILLKNNTVKAIKVEEVTKVVDLALERFLQSERLNL